MTREEYEAWQYTPVDVRLMPGPWFRADGEPLDVEGAVLLATDYMWTADTAITVDDEDLADAVRKNPDLITPAIRTVEVDDGDGGKTVDYDVLRVELADTPKIKADIAKSRLDRATETPAREVIRDA